MSWAVAVALIAGALGAAQNPHASVQILALAVTVIVAIVLLRSRLHETRRPDVELYDDVMVLPTRGARSRTVQYESLRAAVTRGKAPRDELVLEAGGHTYIYPRGSFEDEDGMDVFFLQLRNRLRRHPRGAQIVAEIRHRQNITQRLSRMRPRVTHGLIALIAVVFMLQMYLGSGGYDPVVATVLGANLSSRTLSGEWYRLITANFLHGGMLHIYLNCLALLSLGGALERLLGRWTYLTVFMVSAVGGALASALYNPGVPSQGVSTAVFGLLGAFGVLHLLKALPIGYRQTRGWWTFTLGVNAVLPLIVDVIDVAAHVGGFAVGAAVAYLVLRKRGAQASKGDQALRRPALVLAATYLLAFVWAGSSALAFDARDKAELTDGFYNAQLIRWVDTYTERPSDEHREILAAALAQSATARGIGWVEAEKSDLQAHGSALGVGLDGRVPGNSTVWVLAHREGELSGLVRVRVGAEAALPVWTDFPEALKELDRPTQFSVALVDGRSCECGADVVEASAWPLPEL